MKEEIEGLLETLENELLCRKQYKLLEDYINDLQSQLKAKEEVIKEAIEFIKNKHSSIIYNKETLLEILSKGENK